MRHRKRNNRLIEGDVSITKWELLELSETSGLSIVVEGLKEFFLFVNLKCGYFAGGLYKCFQFKFLVTL